MITEKHNDSQTTSDPAVASSDLLGGLVLRLATRGLVPSEHTLAVWQFADGTGWGAAVTTAYRQFNAEASGDSLQAALEALMRTLNRGADLPPNGEFRRRNPAVSCNDLLAEFVKRELLQRKQSDGLCVAARTNQRRPNRQRSRG